MGESWEQDYSIELASSGFSQEVTVDTVMDGVYAEHENGEQMRANWHLMKLFAAAQAGDEVDAVVLLTLTDNFPGCERTINDVMAVLSPYCGFDHPFIVREYFQEWFE